MTKLCEDKMCEDKVYVSKLCVDKLCVSKLCDDKLCVSKLCEDKMCEDKVYVSKLCVGKLWVRRREAGGGRTAGYRTKNKNPTQRCGEQGRLENSQLKTLWHPAIISDEVWRAPPCC